MATQIKLRRDTSANWASSNPILAQGEPGYDITSKRLKIGDGSTSWNSLAWFDDQITDLSAVAQNVLPEVDITYDLGSPAKRWRDLYLSGNTIYLGGETLSTDATTGAISFSSPVVAPSLTTEVTTIGVGSLQRDVKNLSWTNGVYYVNLGTQPGDAAQPASPVEITINKLSGSYQVDRSAEPPGFYLGDGRGYAQGNYTILGSDLGGTSPANDLLLNVELGVTPIDSIWYSTVTPAGGTPASIRVREGGTWEFVNGGSGWSTDPIAADGTTVTFTPSSGEFDPASSVVLNVLTYDSLNNYAIETYSTNSTNIVFAEGYPHYHISTITVVSGTPSTTDLRSTQISDAGTIALNYPVRSDSNLTVYYYYTVNGGSTQSGYLYSNTPVSELGLVGNVLTITLPTDLIAAGDDSVGYITISETNTSTLEFNADILASGVTLTYTGSFQGFPNRPGAYSLTSNESGYITAITVADRGLRYIPGGAITTGTEPGAVELCTVNVGSVIYPTTVATSDDIEGYISIATLKSIVSASTDFDDFKTRIAGL